MCWPRCTIISFVFHNQRKKKIRITRTRLTGSRPLSGGRLFRVYHSARCSYILSWISSSSLLYTRDCACCLCRFEPTHTIAARPSATFWVINFFLARSLPSTTYHRNKKKTHIKIAWKKQKKAIFLFWKKNQNNIRSVFEAKTQKEAKSGRLCSFLCWLISVFANCVQLSLIFIWRIPLLVVRTRRSEIIGRRSAVMCQRQAAVDKKKLGKCEPISHSIVRCCTAELITKKKHISNLQQCPRQLTTFSHHTLSFAASRSPSCSVSEFLVVFNVLSQLGSSERSAEISSGENPLEISTVQREIWWLHTMQLPAH